MSNLDDRTVNRCARAIASADLPPTPSPSLLKRKIARAVLEEYVGAEPPCTCPPLPDDRTPP